MQAFAFPLKGTGNDRIATAYTRKTGGFGQGTKLYRTFPCPFNAINRTGEIIPYKRFIGGIIQDDRIIFKGIVNPFFELGGIVSRSCRIVRGTQIDNIRMDIFVRHG